MLCTLKHHQKSINTTEFIYRKLQLVKISFLQDPLQIHRQLLHGFSPRSLPIARSKHQLNFSTSRISFIFPAVIQAKTQGFSQLPPHNPAQPRPVHLIRQLPCSLHLPAALVIQPALLCQKPLNRLLSGAPDSKLTPTDPSNSTLMTLAKMYFLLFHSPD